MSVRSLEPSRSEAARAKDPRGLTVQCPRVMTLGPCPHTGPSLDRVRGRDSGVVCPLPGTTAETHGAFFGLAVPGQGREVS